MEEQAAWVQRRLADIREEEQQLEVVRGKLEKKFRILEEGKEGSLKGELYSLEYPFRLLMNLGVIVERKQPTPLEDLKNLLAPLVNMTEDTQSHATPKQQQSRLPSLHPAPFPDISTPITLPYNNPMPSAMKGVVLTATGESLATPTQAELANLFNNSPKVGLNFAKIFEPGGEERERYDSGDEGESPPPSPSKRERPRKEGDSTPESSTLSSVSGLGQGSTAQPTRLRRPSIRTSGRLLHKTTPSSTSDPTGLPIAPSSSVNTSSLSHPKPLPHPHLQSSSAPPIAPTAHRSVTIPLPHSHPSPEYDFADEENLPSPFLKRLDRDRVPMGTVSGRGGLGSKMGKRRSDGNLLRAVAVANAAGRRGASVSALQPVAGDCANAAGVDTAVPGVPTDTRPSLTSARKASEEARKSLLRP